MPERKSGSPRESLRLAQKEEKAEPQGMWGKLKDFLWGLFVLELYKDCLAHKAKYEDALYLIALGELLGIPLMNSVVSLRLLPYLFPELQDWKRRQAQERDVVEEAPHIHA